MKAIEFEEQNCVYAENQDEYISLPAHKTEEGKMISCWKLSWKERFKMLFGGTMWISVHTFNKRLQPLKPSIISPFIEEESV